MKQIEMPPKSDTDTFSLGDFSNNRKTNEKGFFQETKKAYLAIYNRGIKLLSMREHSVQELCTKLQVKDAPIDLVYAALDELQENKYLSDQRFTQSYIRYRTSSGFGPVKIRHELVHKGVSTILIEEYLDVNSGQWYDNAKNQYNKKYGDLKISDYNTWSKQARFLQSRGFTSEQIRVTLPQIETD